MNRAIATIIADSISPQGIRITTFQLRYWRAIHAELMTHRVFSRNAGSSRARPSQAIITQVRTNPWGPIHWGANQSGMQAEVELSENAIKEAKLEWHKAAVRAGDSASWLNKLGLHKQIVNRVLEPFTYIDAVVTATDYANWFALRLDKDAQPEIQQLAQAMKDAMDTSKPVLLNPGEWHLPYIQITDYAEIQDYLPYVITESKNKPEKMLELFKKISAARCARTSYKAFDGKVASIDDDLSLFDKLMSGNLKHASPTEHQATPDYYHEDEYQTKSLWGNFRGWIQYRKTIPNEFIAG